VDLSPEDVAVFLRTGGHLPDGALRSRVETLLSEAPLVPRTLSARIGSRFFLCGTIGAAFDAWQRRLAALSAADAFVAQAIGTAAVECVMDDLESSLCAELPPHEVLLPRRSPGYGDIPLEMSREILSVLDAPKRIGVTLTDACLLVPSKSVTAICAVTAAVNAPFF